MWYTGDSMCGSQGKLSVVHRDSMCGTQGVVSVVHREYYV